MKKYFNLRLNIDIYRVVATLNVASLSVLAIGTYLPEYIRARTSASLIFKMLAKKSKINGLSEGGRKEVIFI